jgi:hypothetical protein
MSEETKPLAADPWKQGDAPSWLLPPTDTSIEQSKQRRAVYLDWLEFNHLRNRARYAMWLKCEGHF